MSNLNHATLGTQVGNMLRIVHKQHAVTQHRRDTTDANFDFRLIETAFSDTDNEEKNAKEILHDARRAEQSGSISSYTSLRTAMDDGLAAIVDIDIPTSAEDEAGGAIDYEYDEALIAETGQVKILRRRGSWGALFHAQSEDGENILQNVVTFGALIANGSNTGVVRQAVSATGLDHLFTGTLTFECVDDTVESSQFSVTHDLASAIGDGTVQRLGDNNMRIGQLFEDGETGIGNYSLEIDPTALVESGDDGAMISSIVVTSPNDAQTDKGQIFLKVTRQAGSPEWLLEQFKASSRQPADIVSKRTASGTAGTVAISFLGSSGFTVAFDFDKTAANTHLPTAGNTDSDILIDIKAPRIGDKWTKAVVNNKQSNFATKLGEAHPASLNSGVAATANWADSKAASISIT